MQCYQLWCFRKQFVIAPFIVNLVSILCDFQDQGWKIDQPSFIPSVVLPHHNFYEDYHNLSSLVHQSRVMASLQPKDKEPKAKEALLLDHQKVLPGYGIFVPFKKHNNDTSDFQIVPVLQHKDGYIVNLGTLTIPKTVHSDNKLQDLKTSVLLDHLPNVKNIIPPIHLSNSPTTKNNEDKFSSNLEGPESFLKNMRKQYRIKYGKDLPINMRAIKEFYQRSRKVLNQPADLKIMRNVQKLNHNSYFPVNMADSVKSHEENNIDSFFPKYSDNNLQGHFINPEEYFLKNMQKQYKMKYGKELPIDVPHSTERSHINNVFKYSDIFNPALDLQSRENLNGQGIVENTSPPTVPLVIANDNPTDLEYDERYLQAMKNNYASKYGQNLPVDMPYLEPHHSHRNNLRFTKPNYGTAVVSNVEDSDIFLRNMQRHYKVKYGKELPLNIADVPKQKSVNDDSSIKRNTTNHGNLLKKQFAELQKYGNIKDHEVGLNKKKPNSSSVSDVSSQSTITLLKAIAESNLKETDNANEINIEKMFQLIPTFFEKKTNYQNDTFNNTELSLFAELLMKSSNKTMLQPKYDKKPNKNLTVETERQFNKDLEENLFRWPMIQNSVYSGSFRQFAKLSTSPTKRPAKIVSTNTRYVQRKIQPCSPRPIHAIVTNAYSNDMQMPTPKPNFMDFVMPENNSNIPAIFLNNNEQILRDLFFNQSFVPSEGNLGSISPLYVSNTSEDSSTSIPTTEIQFSDLNIKFSDMFPLKQSSRRFGKKTAEMYISEFAQKLLKSKMSELLKEEFHKLKEGSVYDEKNLPIAWCGCSRSCSDPIRGWRYDDFRKPYYRQLSLAAVYRCKWRKWIHDNVWFMKETFRNVFLSKRKEDNYGSHTYPPAPGPPDQPPITLDPRIPRPTPGPLGPPGPQEPGRPMRINENRYIAQRGWAKAANGKVPLGAFSVGLNKAGRNVYIGRGSYYQEAGVPPSYGLIPGMVVDNDNCVRFNWRGQEVCQRSYEILVGDEYSWVYNNLKNFHPDRVIGGYEFTVKFLLGICKVTINGDLLIGKVSMTNGRCYIAKQTAKANAERAFDNYMLLIA